MAKIAVSSMPSTDGKEVRIMFNPHHSEQGYLLQVMSRSDIEDLIQKLLNLSLNVFD